MSAFALERAGGLGPRVGVAGLLGLAVLLGLAGVLFPVYALALVFGCAFVVLAVWNLAAGVAVFTALTFFEQLPGLADLPLVKGTGAVLALSWLISTADRRTPAPALARDRPLLAWAAVLLVALSLASSIWATSSSGAISSGIRLAQGVLFVFIVYAAVRTVRQLFWVITAFVAGAALTAVVGLAGGASSEELGPYAETYRLAGGIGDANEFAALLVPSLVFAAFALAVARTALARLAFFSAFGLVTIALLLTESRGGLVALAVTAVAVAVYAGPLRARALAAVCCAGAVGVCYYAFVAPPESLTRITHFSAGGGTGRSDLWTIALEMWRDHPLLGIGAGNFQTVEPRYAVGAANLTRVDLVIDTPKVAHNTYLHVLTELGVVGLTLFLCAIWAALAAAVRAVRRFASRGLLAGELLTRSLVLGAVGMLAAFVFISAQYEKQLWLMLGLLAASASISRKEPAPATASASISRKVPAPATAGPGRRELSADDPEYDPAVSERLAEQLEQRLAERLASLAKEQERLERSRAALAAREGELRERGEQAAALPEREARLDERERSLAEREARLREREAELDRAGLAAGADALRRAEGAVARLSSQLADLESLRAEVAEREADLDARALVIGELEAGAGDRSEDDRAAADALAAREARLAQRERAVEEAEQAHAARVEAITARELALARAAAERARRDASEPPAPEPPASESAPEPAAVPAPELAAGAGAGRITVPELERLVAAADAPPERVEEWRFTLLSLREHGDASGRLPAHFDSLIDEVFGELLPRS